MNDNIKKMARAGYAAKGTVYGITGVLTFLAAFNLGGQKTSNLQVLQYLDQQPFGNVLLGILGLGLLCYAAWRFTQSISDPEGIGEDDKGTIKRIAFFVSGLIYLGFAGIAIWRIIGSGGPSSGSGNSGSGSSFLASSTGLWVLGAVGVIVLLVGLFQFYKVYKQKYKEKFDIQSLSEEKKRKTIVNSANFGISARGVVFMIIGYFALHGALNNNPSEIKTTGEVFSFLQDSSYGSWLLGLVAAGFVCYAIYMFMMAKYRSFKG